MIQTIGLSVGAAVAYIIAVLGLMFYCKKRCKAKRLQKQPEGEEPEMECLNGEGPAGESGALADAACSHGGENKDRRPPTPVLLHGGGEGGDALGPVLPLNFPAFSC